jgi:hypothetical protein
MPATFAAEDDFVLKIAKLCGVPAGVQKRAWAE